jgi:hypothetical protein
MVGLWRGGDRWGWIGDAPGMKLGVGAWSADCSKGNYEGGLRSGNGLGEVRDGASGWMPNHQIPIPKFKPQKAKARIPNPNATPPYAMP